jgi:hypothetical protein
MLEAFAAHNNRVLPPTLVSRTALTSPEVATSRQASRCRELRSKLCLARVTRRR